MDSVSTRAAELRALQTFFEWKESAAFPSRIVKESFSIIATSVLHMRGN
jgi:hypothetical protein